jgi:esterase/lipase superfamily enzyme
MKRIAMICILALFAAGGVFFFDQSQEDNDKSSVFPDGELESRQSVTPIQTLKDQVVAFGNACATWGVGSRQAYGHATELASADFSSSPLTANEIREMKTEFAETMIAKGELAEAIPVLRGIIEDDRLERENIEKTGTVIRLSQQSEMRRTHAARLEQLGALYLETNQPAKALQNIDEEIALLGQIYGANHPGMVFVLQDKIYAAEQAREQGASIGSLHCEKQQLKIIQDNALRWDFADGEDLDAIAPEPIDIDPPATCPEPAVLAQLRDHERVKVFYGTNRKPSKPGKSSKVFGSRMGNLSVGTIEMTVAPDNLVGAYPATGGGGLTGDETHIVLKKLPQTVSKNQFAAELSNWIGQSKNPKKEAFIYIHGHNVQFDSATRRAAQLAISLDMRNGAIMYSWPSGQRMTLYAKSQINARRSAPYLGEFLELVKSVEGVDELHIIAHSMGNDVLTRALNKLELEGFSAEQRPFGQIIWASPDVASADFANFTAAYKTRKIADGMTLYASSKDRALSISNWLSDMKRAGQSPPLANVAGVVPTIDTTNAYREGSDLIAHTDYADGAIDDIKALFWYNLNPDKRCFLGNSQVDNVAYWSAGQGSCSEEAFRSALSMVRAREYAQIDADFNYQQKIDEIRMHVDPDDWAIAEILAQDLDANTQ